MKTNRRSTFRAALIIAMMLGITIASSHLRADTGPCGGATTTLPFTDVSGSNVFFCSIASAYFTGLTNGTTPTTYNPSANVTRDQMAAFISRTLDQSLRRGSRRASLRQWWTPQGAADMSLVSLGNGGVRLVESDGADVWVASNSAGTVSRVRAGDGKLLETWTGATDAYAVMAAKGRIFVTAANTPGKLYQIDPSQPVGPVTTVSASLGSAPTGIAFDGSRVWTANQGGSISIVTLNPLNVTTISTGFSQPVGILFDGTNIWVTDIGDNTLKKVDASGNVLAAVALGNNSGPQVPVFDGTNIWVPNFGLSSLTVVRASTGTVLATLTDNGLSNPSVAAFDGQRILVTNSEGDSVSLWKAADLTPLGTVSTGSNSVPNGACSDGLNFWITLSGTNKLARF